MILRWVSKNEKNAQEVRGVDIRLIKNGLIKPARFKYKLLLYFNLKQNHPWKINEISYSKKV